MATYIWNGTSFTGQTFLPSQFFTDANNNYYYYEQNYNSFFPVTFSNPTVTYSGNGQYQNLPANTSLTQQTSLQSQVATIGPQIIQIRYQNFTNNNSNLLSSSTQTPSDFVSSAVSSSFAANQNLQTSIQQSAGVLTDKSLNFAFSDISGGWNNGSSFIQTLSSFANNHQQNVVGFQSSLQRLTDFKSRILKSAASNADNIQMVQGQTAQSNTQGTYTNLTAAIPNFSQINSLMGNSSTILNKQLTQYLPGQVATTSPTMTNIFTSVFGSTANLPQIVNPLDKILVDLQKYANPPPSLLGNIPIAGFASLMAQTSVVNQVTNLLNQLVAKIATNPTVSIPPQVSNVEQIFTSANSFASQQLQSATTGQLTPLQQQINTILGLVNGSSKSTFSPPPATSDNSFQGGSFNNVGGIATFTASQTSTVQYPNVALSPDPTISTAQQTRNVAQIQANSAGTPGVQTPGDGINIFPDLPLRPRNILANGQLGDYDGSKVIAF